MSKKIAVLMGSVLLLGAFSLPAQARVDVGIQIGVPPPPVQYEVVPGPRAGYVWAPGYWGWDGYRHVWVRGRWIGARRGYHWEPEHWEVRGPYHHFEQGHWERERYYRR